MWHVSLTFKMEQFMCFHESGGGLAETGGLAVSHPRPQPKPHS